MVFPSINLLAVLVASIIYFVLGAVWYGFVVNKPFIRYRNFKEGENTGTPLDYALTFAAEFISVVGLALIVGWAAPTDALNGALLGLLVAVLLLATTLLVYTIYSGPPKMLWVLDSGYIVLGFIIAGVILTVWK